MKALAALALMTGAMAGCAGPLGEEAWQGTCPPMEFSAFRVEAEGRALRGAFLVAGTVFRASLDCDAPPLRTELPAVDGVATGEAGRYDHQEIRLFFDDGTLRLGVDLPSAPSHDLTVRLDPTPSLADGGVAVPVERSEWLDGPEAGRDVSYGNGFVPLRTHDETMAVTVASAWNERLLVQAGMSYEPYVPEPLEDAGGRVRVTVTAPNGTVFATREARDPAGYVSVEAGPGVPAGVWTVRFEHQASNRTHPQMLDTVSAWLTY